MRQLAALVAVALAVPAGGAELAVGALVDAERGAVYLTLPSGALEARDVVTGALRWSQGTAVRPLAAHGGRLLVQVEDEDESLRLVVLDAASGARLHEHVRVLPSGVRAWLDERADEIFTLRVQADGPRVRLAWSYERRPPRGLAEDDGEDIDADNDARRREDGALSVDLASATFAAEPAREPDPPASLPSPLAREADAGAFRERPFAAGAHFVASQRAATGALVLRRFTRDGAALEPLPLADGLRPQLASSDGRHLLLSAPRAGSGPERAHDWSVLALDDGTLAARLSTFTAASPFALTAGRVLVVQQPWSWRHDGRWRDEPRRLEVFEASSGAHLWHAALRDPTYRGPFAP